MEVNMEQKQSTERVLERIAKLMQMADGGTQHEAETAAKMAQQLLMKHNLSMDDVNVDIDEKERAVQDERFNMRDVWKKVEGNWVAILYNQVAINNLCKVITHSGGRWKDITIIGTRANVSMVHFTCEQLIPRLRSAEQREWSNYNGYDKRGVFRRGFLMGSAVGVGQQLAAQLHEMKQEDKNVEGLVIYSDKAVQEYMDNKWKHLGKARRSSTSSRDGFQSGKAVGRNMSIHKGVGGTSTSYGGMLGKGK